MYIPGIIIAGTNSGCGKTTVTAGILAALVKRGLKVQPFKAGPDYIDPMFHTFITGQNSRNLDSWMLDEKTVRYLYARNAIKADIAVVEGVMGLYDGFRGRSEAGSTAHIAKITGLPVILIVNPDGMALSAAALIKGFMDFDTNVPVKGVIFNNIDSEGHYILLKNLVKENTGAKVLGYLRRMEQYKLDNRHLGLVTASEVDNLKEKMDKLCGQVEETVDLECLLEIAGQAATFYGAGLNSAGFAQIAGLIDSMGRKSRTADYPGRKPEPFDSTGRKRVKIAIAKDKAFCFYYADNLELLEALGAELAYFSPIADSRLPDDIDGLYIGGGYPEVWAKELECNMSMRLDIKEMIEDGLPAYAECGGMMYMCKALIDGKGNIYEMAGLLPGTSKMSTTLKRFGYSDIEIKNDNVMSCKGQKIRGHEFHFSETDIAPKVETCYKVSQKRIYGTEVVWDCGYKVKNLLAGYAHLHFWSNPLFAAQFVDNCRNRNIEKKKNL